MFPQLKKLKTSASVIDRFVLHTKVYSCKDHLKTTSIQPSLMYQVISSPSLSYKGQILTTKRKWPLFREGDLAHTVTRTTSHIPLYVDIETSSKTYLSLYKIIRRHIPGYSNRNTDKSFFRVGNGHKPPCVNFEKKLIGVAGFAAANLQKEKEILCSWNRTLLDVNLLRGISILCCIHIYTRIVLAYI
jgi:hypothetical protein